MMGIVAHSRDAGQVGLSGHPPVQGRLTGLEGGAVASSVQLRT